MSGRIVDDVAHLLTLSPEELDELLLRDAYNKANLRELVRRALASAAEYKQAFEYEISEERREAERLNAYYKD